MFADQDSVQMLQRSSQVGEFYRMAPPAVWDHFQRLPPSYLDIMIYDEESDRHVHIPFKQALYATCYGNANGPRGDLFHFKDLDPADLKKVTDSMALTKAYGGETTTAADAGAKTLKKFGEDADADKANPVTTLEKDIVDEVVRLVDLGVWLPVEIVIARPFIAHLMLSAVVAVAGRDTGATLFGPADMQISANTSVKTIEGHYTCHTKSVITKPQNVCVMRDVMCSGYVAGGNTRFFGVGNSGLNASLNPQLVRDSMEARLSFQDDANAEYSSMLAFCAPFGDGAKRDQVISISSRLLPWEVNRPQDERKEYFPGNKYNFDAVKTTIGLDTIHFGEDVRAAENMEFISQVSVAPSKPLSCTHQK